MPYKEDKLGHLEKLIEYFLYHKKNKEVKIVDDSMSEDEINF